MANDWQGHPLDVLFEDSRLSATDKACYVFLVLRTDATGEYRFGIQYLAKHVGINWRTARQSMQRLTECGYIGSINQNTSHTTWRVVRNATEVVSFAISPAVGPTSPSPQDAPRMAMPPELASDILHWFIFVRKMLDAALTSDMKGIAATDRTLWMALSDHVDDIMDTFTRWMQRFGGGVPEDRQRELDEIG